MSSALPSSTTGRALHSAFPPPFRPRPNLYTRDPPMIEASFIRYTAIFDVARVEQYHYSPSVTPCTISLAEVQNVKEGRKSYLAAQEVRSTARAKSQKYLDAMNKFYESGFIGEGSAKLVSYVSNDLSALYLSLMLHPQGRYQGDEYAIAVIKDSNNPEEEYLKKEYELLLMCTELKRMFDKEVEALLAKEPMDNSGVPSKLEHFIGSFSYSYNFIYSYRLLFQQCRCFPWQVHSALSRGGSWKRMVPRYKVTPMRHQRDSTSQVHR